MTARADFTRELEQKRTHLTHCLLVPLESRRIYASMKVTAFELNRTYSLHMTFGHDEEVKRSAKVYIVFTGREDFGEGTVATMGDLHSIDDRRYAIFTHAADAEKFKTELRAVVHTRLSLNTLWCPYIDASVVEFEVIE